MGVISGPAGDRSAVHSLGVGCGGLLKHAWLLQELGKPGMGLGWRVEGSHKGIPLRGIQLNLAEHDGPAAVDDSDPGRKPQVQFFRAHSQRATGFGTTGLDAKTHI